MSYWLFLITDGLEVFKKRIDSKTWPIFNQTAHKKELDIGDAIIFYKAGSDGQKFLGTAKIASKLLRRSALKTKDRLFLIAHREERTNMSSFPRSKTGIKFLGELGDKPPLFGTGILRFIHQYVVDTTV